MMPVTGGVSPIETLPQLRCPRADIRLRGHCPVVSRHHPHVGFRLNQFAPAQVLRSKWTRKTGLYNAANTPKIQAQVTRFKVNCELLGGDRGSVTRRGLAVGLLQRRYPRRLALDP